MHIFAFFSNVTAPTDIYTLSYTTLFRSAHHQTDERDSRHVVRDAEERVLRSEEHTSELQSLAYIVCRLLLEKKMMRDVHRHFRCKEFCHRGFKRISRTTLLVFLLHHCRV